MELFYDKIALPRASLKTLVNEAKQITSSDSLGYIRDLFVKLSHMIDEALYTELTDSGCSDLSHREIFPVWSGKRKPSFDALRNGTQSCRGDSWYVADTSHLLGCFEGHCPVLAFEALDIREMRHFIDYTFKHRRLSNLAIKVPMVEGKEKFDEGYTIFMRRRAKYVARCVLNSVQTLNPVQR